MGYVSSIRHLQACVLYSLEHLVRIVARLEACQHAQLMFPCLPFPLPLFLWRVRQTMRWLMPTVVVETDL